MDSRNTVYGAARFKAHDAVLSGRDLPQMERWLAQVDAVLIRTLQQDATRGLLTRRLDEDDEWLSIHFDQYCRMWLKKQAAPSLRKKR